MKRTVFFISDGTGITAETLGHSLLTQFSHIEFDFVTIPYVDNAEKANAVIKQINEAAKKTHFRPLIFATLINPEIRKIITTCDGLLLDFFNTFINPLETELKTQSSPSVGRTHGLVDYTAYNTRIDAVNYALSHDDGVSTKNYNHADLILIGVSRSGKTPTCLYLALQFGIFVANYPFTEDDMTVLKLPDFLAQNRHKLFGLTIDKHRLHDIRSERRANSNYASLKQCEYEIEKVEALFQKEKIPFLSTTTRSIEEIATTILATTGVKRRLH